MNSKMSEQLHPELAAAYRDWDWLLQANAENPFSDAELAEMDMTREELDWHIARAEQQ